MKFRKQISITFLIAILIPFTILVLITSLNFNSSFREYLEYEQNIKFQSIEQMVTEIMNAPYPIGQKRELLKNYIANEQLQLQILDKDNNILLDIDALPDTNIQPDNEIIRKDYPLIDNNQQVGTIQFSFIDTNYTDIMTKSFSQTMFKFLFISCIIALMSTIIMNYFIAHALSRPISFLSIATNQIKDGEFEKLNLPSSDIYEIETLNNDIEYLANTLKHQKAIRENYAQDISHELRTPLTNLQLHIEALKDGIIDPSEENYETILNELLRLNVIVTGLKESFSGAIKEELSISRFNVEELLNEITIAVNPSFLKKEVLLIVNLEKSITISTDKDKLTQIIQNLLSNALKACEKDDKVYLTLTHRHHKILISIRDTGIGMAEESISNIFDRFYRVDNVRNTKTSGSGLGLSIVKNYTNRLGGKILVNSKEGLGSEFILEFSDKIIDTAEIAEKSM